VKYFWDVTHLCARDGVVLLLAQPLCHNFADDGFNPAVAEHKLLQSTDLVANSIPRSRSALVARSKLLQRSTMIADRVHVARHAMLHDHLAVTAGVGDVCVAVPYLHINSELNYQMSMQVSGCLHTVRLKPASLMMRCRVTGDQTPCCSCSERPQHTV
jgi:hypothetical protein